MKIFLPFACRDCSLEVEELTDLEHAPPMGESNTASPTCAKCKKPMIRLVPQFYTKIPAKNQHAGRL